MKMLTFFKRFLFITPILIFFGNLNSIAQPDRFNFDNFTLDNGLSNNIIHCALQDQKGFLWFGTNHGICRFDGYKFTTFRNNPTDSNSLSGVLARVIYEDKKGNLWIGTESGGLNLFDRNKEQFRHILPLFDDNSIGSSVKTIAEDNTGILWLGTNIGIKAYDPKAKKVKTYAYKSNDNNSPSDNYIRILHFDNNGKLWIGTNAGLDIFDPQTESFVRFSENEPLLKDEIWEIYSDKNGNIWIGTYNNGLFVFDPNTLVYKQMLLDNNNDRSRTVRAIIQDKSGIYWVGTRDGLYLYDRNKNKSSLLINEEHEPRSLVHNSILDIYPDKNNNIWICTRGGISLMVPERQVFKNFKAMPDNNRYLNNGEIYAIWVNKTTNEIWLGTDKGGVNIYNPKTEQYRYLTRTSGKNRLSSNCIKAFLNDNNGNVWIATFRGGINVYNLKTEKITLFRHQETDPESLSSDIVWSMLLDSKGNIWIGTQAGLDRFDPKTKKFIHYRNIDQGRDVNWINQDSNGDLWLGQGSRLHIFRPNQGLVAGYTEQCRWFHEDSKGRYWVATLNNGLVLYDKLKGPIKYFSEEDGLPNNQVFHILEDYSGCLWLSTGYGLARFDVENSWFTNFDVKDGLQNNQFLYGAGYKSPTGEFIFGGINGFNIFNPREVAKNMAEPNIVLTDFKILNKSVKIGEFDSLLQKSVSELTEITIPYKFNVFTFEFTALNFARSEKNRYRYKLEGFDKNWIESGVQRVATYTNLDPGQYYFKVQASNNDNIWNKRGISVKVTILPPFWKTWWFKTLVVLLLITIVYFLVLFTLNREKLKNELILERVKARQMHELDMMKLRFFTNISHEIRTPLTLILGPLDRIKHGLLPSEQLKGSIDMMHRNATLLLKLINQLLDFRKVEAGSLKLDLRKGDMVAFVQNLVKSFVYLANEKDIRLKFNAVNDNLFVFFDSDKLEKIINNLLSNAFKFTEKGGTITVNISVLVDDNLNEVNESSKFERYIEIVVKDTGIGIAPENMDKIFNRFFQSPDNENHSGTGIGLALTRELVKLHNGQIFVESKKGKGAKFSVRLPLIYELQNESNELTSPENAENDNIHEQAISSIQSGDLLTEKIMLVVEDNPDVRQFIRNNFDTDFHIEEAVDGKEGYAIAQKLIPDIILTDVMMPVMDGKELCKKLKKDERTSHIPVLILTALSSKESTIEGLSSGADDYITKPFDITILRTKIDNLLSIRKTLRDKFSGELILAPTNISVTSPDEKFLRKAIEIIEKNIEDADFDTEKFSSIIGVSRMQLYRKLSALTNMTVKEFIRDIRLKRAAQLLLQRKLSISEIAYSTGFKDMSHFRKCFRDKYGMSATDYIEKGGL